MSEAVYDLNAFSLSDVVRCGTQLRQIAAGAADFDDACRQIVGYLHAQVVDGATAEPGFLLVQMIHLGTGGSAEIVAALGDRLDWSLGTPRPTRPELVAELRGRLDGPHGSFHVGPASDSALNPDDEFATTYGVRSILGLGGSLPDGGFAVLAFSRVPLDRETGGLFEAVAVNLRLGLLDHFAPTALQRESAVSELLSVLERTATAQAAQLEEQIAELSGTAVRLRRSQHELRRREARLREDTGIAEALHMVGTDLSAELDVERVVQRATDVATKLTGAAFGSFFYNVTDDIGESYLLYTLSGVPRAAFAQFPMPRNTRIFDQTFRGTAIVRSDDITKDPRYGHNAPYHGVPPGHLPVVSYLAVPAVSPTGDTIGGFFFGHPRPGRFTERHERLAVGVAAHAAVALDNARLYRRERTAAVELQRSLLPRIQAHEGLEVRSRYLPAAKGTEVGGDWMDLVPLSAGRVALVIGDVMGKGIRAAAVMGQLRTAIRAYASLDLAPGRLMRQLNASISTDLAAEMATCLYVVLDLVHQRLTYANAGHLPLAVVSGDGSARLLDRVVGPPLGTGDYPYMEGTAPLPAGESLLLYTDGLIERRDTGIDKRLTALLDSLSQRPRPTPESVDGLIDDLVDREHHDDDIALLYVRQPPAAIPLTARRTFPATTLSSRDARLFAEETARQWTVPPAVLDSIVAVVAELVANATLHARTSVVELRLHRLPGVFAVEIFDQDNRLPFLIEPTYDDEHHRGLQIVRASAARWGTRAVHDGKVVWAEITAP